MEGIAYVTYFWLFVYFIMGATAYIIDKRYGVRIYNTFRKWTMNEQKFKVLEKGFLYNRTLKTKIFYGTILSTIIGVGIFILGTVGIETKIVLWIFETFFLVLGIILGPVYKKFLFFWSKGLNKLDKIENEYETGQFSKAIKNKTEEIKEDIIAKADEIKDDINDTFSNKEEPKTTLEDKNKAFNDLLKK